jgi:hypothetical protein
MVRAEGDFSDCRQDGDEDEDEDVKDVDSVTCIEQVCTITA